MVDGSGGMGVMGKGQAGQAEGSLWKGKEARGRLARKRRHETVTQRMAAGPTRYTRQEPAWRTLMANSLDGAGSLVRHARKPAQ